MLNHLYAPLLTKIKSGEYSSLEEFIREKENIFEEFRANQEVKFTQLEYLLVLHMIFRFVET